MSVNTTKIMFNVGTSKDISMLFITYFSIKAGLSVSSHGSTHSTLRWNSASLSNELELDSPTLFAIACVMLHLHYCGL